MANKIPVEWKPSRCQAAKQAGFFEDLWGLRKARGVYRFTIALATGLVGSLSFALEFYLSREPEIESG